MPKLSQLVKLEPRTSTIDVLCECNPQHETRKFALLTVKSIVTTEPLKGEFKDISEQDDVNAARVFGLPARVLP